jgi:hypothetical protein
MLSVIKVGLMDVSVVFDAESRNPILTSMRSVGRC